jgi:hypothetical protein
MNTALEIKTSLINRINSTDDLNFLQAVQTIFEAAEKNLFQLTDKQSKSIEISRNQIASGQYKENQIVLSELKKWLKSE